MMAGSNRVFLGERFSVEVNARGLDGSGSRAAWNLRGFVAVHGLLQCPVASEKPLSPWVTSLLDLNFPINKLLRY